MDRHFLSGLAFLALMALVGASALALYRGDFEDEETITVEADRAGLTMDVGSAVKVRGVEVGTVTAVENDGDRVRIEASIDGDRFADIPADVTAQLVPPTAFGAKYVQLSAPSGASGSLRPGDVIAADRVTVEINQAFSHLSTLLDAARPADVNNALTAVATAVDGRGDELNRTVDDLESYLADLDPSLEGLAEDLRRSDDVLDTYATAVPDLLRAADAAGTTARTVRERQSSLRALLVGLDDTAGRADRLLAATRADLTRTVNLSAPVTGVLERYAPELPCLIPGIVRVNDLGESAVGGGEFPGVVTFTRIQHQDPPYRYPANLPQIQDRGGPGCYGLPVVSAAEAQHPFRDFLTGANPSQPGSETAAETTGTTLLGLLAGLVQAGGVR